MPKGKYKIPNLDYKEDETDTEYFIRLAKQADQRLVRIEEAAGLRGKAPDPTYSELYKFAYNKALESMEEGQIRFNQKIPQPGTFEWRERKNAMLEFLRSPTSTKSGAGMIKNAADKINKNYGTNFTWSEFASFIESGDFEKLKENYGSDVILKSIGKIQDADKKVKEGLDKHREKTKGPDPADDVALDIMRSKKHLSFKRNMTKYEKEQIKKELRDL